ERTEPTPKQLPSQHKGNDGGSKELAGASPSPATQTGQAQQFVNNPFADLHQEKEDRGQN
ncbi:MAG: hypothetical protein N3G20_05760, partial [Verrucomicrobiae bacterium]|nr:hypothetical protein [Verrucomicrobiae bacterium]